MPVESSISSEAANHSSAGPKSSSARKLQFGHKIKEETTTISTNMCNRHGFHPYYVPAHSSVMTIPARSQNGASTLRSIPVPINPAAATYYKLSQQHPSAPREINFPVVKRPNIQSLYVSSSSSNLVQHQFNSSPVELPPSWTSAPSSIGSEPPSKLLYPADTKQPQSPPLANPSLLPHSISSLCDSGTTCTVVVESTTAPTSNPPTTAPTSNPPRPLHPPTTQSPAVATPESTWGEQSLPPTRAAATNQHQQLYNEFSLSSVPTAQELGSSWASSSMFQPTQAFN